LVIEKNSINGCWDISARAGIYQNDYLRYFFH